MLQLEQSSYGADAKHKEISLGKGDVFKLHAVLESDSASVDPKFHSFCNWNKWYFCKR